MVTFTTWHDYDEEGICRVVLKSLPGKQDGWKSVSSGQMYHQVEMSTLHFIHGEEDWQGGGGKEGGSRER